jgi:putative ABC transport system permease protein
MVDLRDEIVGDQQRPLAVLMGAVGLVLLIACANVAGLLLSRATAREREMAVRSALGATRGRLMRQLVVENVILAVAGGALGMLVSVWGTDALIHLGSSRIGRLHEVQFDWTTFAFASATSLAAGIFFGLAPAWHVSRASLQASMKEGSPGAGSSRQNVRSALVVGEVALAVIVVTGAGLLAESFVKLLDVDPGFRPEGLFAFSFSLPSAKYEEDPQIIAFAVQALERARRLPGVEGAALTSSLPFGTNWWNTFVHITGNAQSREEQVTTYVRLITPDCFRVMRIPFQRGRDFTERDRAGAPHVVIVNESLVRRLFPDTDPLGKHMTVDDVNYEIVGVVGDTRQRSLDTNGGLEAYVPFLQFPSSHFSIMIRGGGAGLLASMKTEVARLDADVPMERALSMEEMVAQSFVPRRFSLSLMGFFAVSALLLAVLGLYGVLAYAVGRRTREIAVRLALGAQRADVLRMVLGQGLALTVAGVMLGVFGALAITRFLKGMLFQVEALDGQVFSAVVLLVICVGVAACLIPARRATRIDPLTALRYE